MKSYLGPGKAKLDKKMRKVDVQFVLLHGEQPESILDLTKLELEGTGNLD